MILEELDPRLVVRFDAQQILDVICYPLTPPTLLPPIYIHTILFKYCINPLHLTIKVHIFEHHVK